MDYSLKLLHHSAQLKFFGYNLLREEPGDGLVEHTYSLNCVNSSTITTNPT